MVVILKTMFMRDLRGNWVFPRLAYAVTGEAIDRNVRRLYRFLVKQPGNRIREFFTTLRDHEDLIQVLTAGFAALSALLRSLALLITAIGALFVALSRF